MYSVYFIPCIIQERVVFTRNTYYSEALRVYSGSRLEKGPGTTLVDFKVGVLGVRPTPTLP